MKTAAISIATLLTLGMMAPYAMAGDNWFFLVSRSDDSNSIYSYATEAECDRGRANYVRLNGSTGVGSCSYLEPLQ